MASWDDLERLTFDEMELFTFDDFESLSIDQILRVRDELWPLVSLLTPEERSELREGILSEALPTALLADAEPRYSKVQAVALKIWANMLPQDRGEALQYIAILVALLSPVLVSAVAPPPAEEIKIQIEIDLNGEVLPVPSTTDVDEPEQPREI